MSSAASDTLAGVLEHVTVTRYVTPLREGRPTAAVRAALSAFEKACTEGPLAGRPLGERFRWLTAPRSTIVQPGPVHSGLTTDPAGELTHLFDTLVRTR